MSRKNEWITLPHDGPWVCPRRCIVRETDRNRILVEWLEPEPRDVRKQIIVYAATIITLTAAAVAWSVL